MKDQDQSNEKEYNPISLKCLNCGDEFVDHHPRCRRCKEILRSANAKDEHHTFKIVVASIFAFILIPLGIYFQWIPNPDGWIILYLFILLYGSIVSFTKNGNDQGFLDWVWIALWFIAVGGSILGSIIWILDNTGCTRLSIIC